MIIWLSIERYFHIVYYDNITIFIPNFNGAIFALLWQWIVVVQRKLKIRISYCFHRSWYAVCAHLKLSIYNRLSYLTSWYNQSVFMVFPDELFTIRSTICQATSLLNNWMHKKYTDVLKPYYLTKNHFSYKG